MHHISKHLPIFKNLPYAVAGNDVSTSLVSHDETIYRPAVCTHTLCDDDSMI